MSKSILSGSIGLMALAVALVAQADNIQDFSLLNSTGATISNVYVSPHSSNRWGPDILGQDVLENNQTAAISFPGTVDPSVCQWDIKITEDGHDYTVMDVNLCATSNLTFRRNGAVVTYSAR